MQRAPACTPQRCGRKQASCVEMYEARSGAWNSLLLSASSTAAFSRCLLPADPVCQCPVHRPNPLLSCLNSCTPAPFQAPSPCHPLPCRTPPRPHGMVVPALTAALLVHSQEAAVARYPPSSVHHLSTIPAFTCSPPGRLLAPSERSSRNHPVPRSCSPKQTQTSGRRTPVRLHLLLP